MPGANLQSCDTLAGAPVVDALGKGVGIVDELWLDLDSGRVAYALVSCCGAGAADQLVPVPWRWLRFDRGGQRFVLTTGRALIEQAPRRGRESWPDFSDAGWQQHVVEYYSRAFRPQAPPGGRPH